MNSKHPNSDGIDIQIHDSQMSCIQSNEERKKMGSVNMCMSKFINKHNMYSFLKKKTIINNP